MGMVDNITADTCPRQGSWLGREVKVCFHFDTSKVLRGRCIRDDAEEPGEMIFMLEDERVVRAVECMYS